MYEVQMKNELEIMRSFLKYDDEQLGNLGTFRIYSPLSSYSYGENVFGASFMLYQDLRDAIRNAGASGYQIITNAIT